MDTITIEVTPEECGRIRCALQGRAAHWLELAAEYPQQHRHFATAEWRELIDLADRMLEASLKHKMKQRMKAMTHE